jgi:hypothetical protein
MVTREEDGGGWPNLEFATHSVQERATAFRVFVQSTRRQPGLRETHRDLNGPSFPGSEAGGRVNMRRSL